MRSMRFVISIVTKKNQVVKKEIQINQRAPKEQSIPPSSLDSGFEMEDQIRSFRVSSVLGANSIAQRREPDQPLLWDQGGFLIRRKFVVKWRPNERR